MQHSCKTTKGGEHMDCYSMAAEIITDVIVSNNPLLDRDLIYEGVLEDLETYSLTDLQDERR